MFVRTFAGAVAGIDAVAVTVEVNIAGGGLGMYLVGLPDNAVKESEQRIRAAFENSGERMSGKKVVVSLAPADLRKEGSGFDQDEIMVPFHLALTDEQTNQINRGGYGAWDIYLSDRSVRNFVRVAKNYFTPDYIERVGRRIDKAIQVLEERYDLK